MAWALEYIGDVPLQEAGFDPFDGATPQLRYSADGSWLLGFSGRFLSGPYAAQGFGEWWFRWVGGTAPVEVIGLTTTLRGASTVAQKQAFTFGFTNKRVKIHRVNGFVPTDDDENVAG